MSADGTADSIRRRAASRCRERICPFSCGSPSDSRCSRLASSRVIRRSARWRNHWNGTSKSASTKSSRIESPSPPTTSAMAWPTEPTRDPCESAANSGKRSMAYQLPMAPSRLASSDSFRNSTRFRSEKMRLRPLAGLMREILTPSALTLRLKPPGMVLAAMAAAQTDSRMASVRQPRSPKCASVGCSASRKYSRTWPSKAKVLAISRRMPSASDGPIRASAPMPAPITSRCATSRERGTLPSSRAFLRRCSEAGTAIFLAGLGH